MSTTKTRWPYAEARAVADELLALLTPATERIAIAGSVRRERPDCGDVELVFIPRPASLGFYADAVDELIRSEGSPFMLRPAINGATTYGPKNKLLIHKPSGINVDLFATEERYFGMSLLVRTGPQSFCVKVMSHFKGMGWAGHAYGGATNRNGEEVEFPTEEGVFKVLGWQWIEPRERS